MELASVDSAPTSSVGRPANTRRSWLLSGVRELGLCRLIVNQTLCDPLVREDGLMVLQDVRRCSTPLDPHRRQPLTPTLLEAAS